MAPSQEVKKSPIVFKESKKTFIEKLVNKFIVIFFSNENAQFICNNVFQKFDDNHFQKNLYLSFFNKEIATFSLKPLLIKSENYATCGDIVDFKLQPIDRKSSNIIDNPGICLDENTDRLFLEILSEAKENSKYKIELYDYNSSENHAYFLEVNGVKVSHPKNNVGSFFNPKIEKIGEGQKLYCSKNLLINLSYQKYFNDNYKNLGSFSLDLNDNNIDREFRKIVAKQRHGSEISLVCDDIFLKSLAKHIDNLPKILIIKIEVI